MELKNIAQNLRLHKKEVEKEDLKRPFRDVFLVEALVRGAECLEMLAQSIEDLEKEKLEGNSIEVQKYNEGLDVAINRLKISRLRLEEPYDVNMHID